MENLKDKNLYFIGGVVRDELLKIESFDTDITYVGNAIEFAKNNPQLNIIQINEPFGTVKVELNEKQIDIASTRDETYPQKGHLPVVDNIGCDLKTDVIRRDFTINTLAKSTLTSEIIDYTNGIDDLKNKILRVLHDNSFIDDPTRIIRGLKFSIRFGFELDVHTKKLQNDYLSNINYDMSYKRLKKELIETFNLNSQLAFNKFIDENIYKLISPAHFEKPNVNLEELINKYKPNCIWIIYIGLLPDISNLPLTKLEQKIVEDYKKLQTLNFHNNFEIYKNFEKVEQEAIIMFATKNEQVVTHYLNDLKNIKLEITGKDLQDLVIKPSKKYKECFDYVLDKKLSNPSISKEEELNLVKKFFNK